MSDPSDIAARTQRFNDAVRTFTPPSPIRHAKLMPFKDGIIELRQKGASLRLIQELLATANVGVGTDTIARFLAEVTGETTPQSVTKSRKRRSRVAARPVSPHPPAAHPVPSPTPVPATTESPPAPPPFVAPVATTPADRSRIRGPRIADPSNL
jgi:hypothetical protein